MSRAASMCAAASDSRFVNFPTAAQVQSELTRVKVKNRNVMTVCSVVGIALVAAAIAILISIFLLPVVRVYGSSMAPALEEDDIVLAVKDTNPQPGDMVAFYYGNQVLVKRVIAGPGDWVDILADGTVTVNAVPIQERYSVQHDRGNPTVELPYQVPADSYFVLGDNRAISVDSRNALMGAVQSDQVLGRLVFRVWPLDRFGLLG